MNHPENALNQWVASVLHPNAYTFMPLAGDASLRRYFRVQSRGQTFILMDASKDQDGFQPFIEKSLLLTQVGVRTPRIYHFSMPLCYALLEDFGDTLLLSTLTKENVNPFYQSAMQLILKMQACNTDSIPQFNATHIAGELALFREWFLTRYLQLILTPAEETILQEIFDCLILNLTRQPQVFIHRDYHSRNIMVTTNSDSSLGIIDFQDAMRGPFAYDLVSLLKDCYIKWPTPQILGWVHDFYYQLPQREISLAQFQQAFDFCGLQRHLKVLGIFCRLHFRDNKSHYLQDLPLVFHYTLSCLKQYPEFKSFYDLMQRRIKDRFEEKVAI